MTLVLSTFFFLLLMYFFLHLHLPPAPSLSVAFFLSLNMVLVSVCVERTTFPRPCSFEKKKANRWDTGTKKKGTDDEDGKKFINFFLQNTRISNV